MPLTAVIMAGGRGERLWPKSTTLRPKQFHAFGGKLTLLQVAVERIRQLVPWTQIYVITGRQYAETVYGQLPSLPRQNVILEPVGRDTAPCIGYAALHVEAKFPGAIMVLLPADHYVGDADDFLETLNVAAEAATREPALVTIGLKPLRPETGYGYIQLGPEAYQVGNRSVHQVARFVEKPPLERALQLCQDGQHLWNSGMFVWQVEAIRSAIARYMPELHHGLERIRLSLGTSSAASVVDELFPSLPKISVDFGIMEKAERVLVVPASFAWDDLGNWVALKRVTPRDPDGNSLTGRIGTLDVSNCVIQDDTGVTVAIGVRDLVVVRSGDSLLVCDQRRAQDVKQAAALAEKLQTARGEHVHGCQDYPIVEKPWGREIWWGITESYAGKILEVYAGHSLSLQYHRRKLETLYFQRGRGTLILGNQKLAIEPGMAVTVRPGTVHKIIADSDLTILEVSTTELDDVVRLQDSYGRVQAQVAVGVEEDGGSAGD